MTKSFVGDGTPDLELIKPKNIKDEDSRFLRDCR